MTKRQKTFTQEDLDNALVAAARRIETLVEIAEETLDKAGIPKNRRNSGALTLLETAIECFAHNIYSNLGLCECSDNTTLSPLDTTLGGLSDQDFQK